MLGLSYGQLLLLIGAAAALTGPRDFPRISRAAGRLAGRAIAYVQLARGQFENVMQQSQAQQVHKELQDTMTQLEAIRHEIRSVSFMNPGPLTRRLVDNLDHTSATDGNMEPETVNKENTLTTTTPKDSSPTTSSSSNNHSQATAYERLAESAASESGSMNSEAFNELTGASGLLTVLPVSAESAGLLPNRRDDINGSDLVLEAIVEAEVACNAKEFFSQPQNQIKPEIFHTTRYVIQTLRFTLKYPSDTQTLEQWAHEYDPVSKRHSKGQMGLVAEENLRGGEQSQVIPS